MMIRDNEQAIYYLSRIMIRAEHRYNPIEKGMFGVGVRRPENAALLSGLDYKCYIKGQPFKVAYDEAIVAKYSTGKMGHTTLPI